jgi:hypothetical protein
MTALNMHDMVPKIPARPGPEKQLHMTGLGKRGNFSSSHLRSIRAILQNALHPIEEGRLTGIQAIHFLCMFLRLA